jgi:hypothetical protein
VEGVSGFEGGAAGATGCQSKGRRGGGVAGVRYCKSEGPYWDSLRLILPRVKGNPTNAGGVVVARTAVAK